LEGVEVWRPVFVLDLLAMMAAFISVVSVVIFLQIAKRIARKS
jgi:hypothetical protein